MFPTYKKCPLSSLNLFTIGTTFSYIFIASEGNSSLFKCSSSYASSESGPDNLILVQNYQAGGLQEECSGIHFCKNVVDRGEEETG